MALIRALLFRALSLIAVVLTVLVLVVFILGATGFSDRLLRAVVSEQLRAVRQQLAERIHDPGELERVVRDQRRQLESYYGLDKPWYVRIPQDVLRVLTLDLGEARTVSTAQGSKRIKDIIQERLPRTVLLFTTALLINFFIGISIGVTLATRAGSLLDRVFSYFSAVSYAMPSWWTGILLILILAFYLGLLPAGGMYSAPPPEGGLARFLDLGRHAILPVLTLVLAGVGPSIYLARTITLNVAQEDHVTFARAKGLPERLVRWRHILRVAAPPIVTGFILGLVGSIAGAITVEIVFRWPGMGQLYFQAVAGQPDESLIVALTFVYTLLYAAARFLLEILYLFLDPRVRY
jgi:peptide/nickel transport system permease protein